VLKVLFKLEYPMIVPIKKTININCQSSIGTGGLSHQGGGFGVKQAGFGGLLL